jgi:hypothetical protein
MSCDLWRSSPLLLGVAQDVLKTETFSIDCTAGSAFCLWGAGETSPSRLVFIPVGETKESSPDFDSCLVYFGANKTRAVSIMDRYGHAWTR